jgi:hypothetical protein
MANNTICELWSALAADPTKAEVIAEGRERLVELMQHLEYCQGCQKIDDELLDPHAVFDALSGGGVQLSEEERRTIAWLNEAATNDRESIVTAVRDILLPSLPANLGELDRAPGKVSELAVFRAIDAVNLLVTSYATAQRKKRIVLGEDGLLLGKTRAATRETILVTIQRRAKVDEALSGFLFNWQLEAAQTCRQLYSTLLVTAVENSSLVLKIDLDGANANWSDRWQPVEDELTPAELFMHLKQMYSINAGQMVVLEAVAKSAKRQPASKEVMHEIRVELRNARQESVVLKKMLSQCMVEVKRLHPFEALDALSEAVSRKEQLGKRIVRVQGGYRAKPRAAGGVMKRYFMKDYVLKQELTVKPDKPLWGSAHRGQTSTGVVKGRELLIK